MYIKNNKEFSKEFSKVMGYDAFALKEDFLGYEALMKKIKTNRDNKECEICIEIKKYNGIKELEELNNLLICAIKEKNTKEIETICSKCLEKYNDIDIDIDTIKKLKNINNWNAYFLVMKMGIKTCPYCNRHYITPLYSEKKGSLRADLDHFFAKSKYPYLSMSLYNLVPCCKFCNSSLKNSKDFKYSEYLNPYEYGFENYLKFKYKLSKYTLSGNNNQELKIVLESEEEKDSKEIILKAKNNAKCFKLESLYNYHLDEVRELIKKKLVYNKVYCKELRNRLKKIIGEDISNKKLKEFIYSKVIETEKLHKHTLSKFYKDIIEQLDACETEKNYDLTEKEYKELKKLI